MVSSLNRYYGQSSCPLSQVRLPSYSTSMENSFERTFLLLAFGGILFGYVNPIIASAQFPPSDLRIVIGMIQERLEESLQWKIGW